nr:u11:u12 small nuclear ribonucleoprotein 48 kda [Hymenolepis microstoma]
MSIYSMDSLDDVLNFLGWTSESLDNIPETQKCSINSEHLIPKNRVDIHMEKCRMRQQGYTKEQINAFWSYSADEIRKFSEAALQSNAAKLPPDLIFDLSNTHFYQERDSKKILDHERAFVRDLKRRRQSYRGIHTARKPYIEILREVIEHQIALLSGSTSSNL